MLLFKVATGLSRPRTCYIQKRDRPAAASCLLCSKSRPASLGPVHVISSKSRPASRGPVHVIFFRFFVLCLQALRPPPFDTWCYNSLANHFRALGFAPFMDFFPEPSMYNSILSYVIFGQLALCPLLWIRLISFAQHHGTHSKLLCIGPPSLLILTRWLPRNHASVFVFLTTEAYCFIVCSRFIPCYEYGLVKLLYFPIILYRILLTLML